jgi:folate-binding protein YgfZ
LHAGRERPGYRAREAAVLAVEGHDREVFLQGQLTQDVRGLRAGEARPAAGLTPTGKLLYAGLLVALSDRYLLVLDGDRDDVAAPAVSHLSRFAAFQKAAVSDISRGWILRTLYGPGPEGIALPRGALRLPARGETSGEILAPAASGGALEAALAGAGSERVSSEEAETLRVEAGRALFGKDADASNIPDEVGLQAAVSTAKGCYVGQEVVARLRHHGKVARRLVGFRFPGGPVAEGTAFADPGKPGRTLATVTTSVISPRFGAIGLGLAARDVVEGAALSASDAPERVAVVVGLPFA